MSSRAGRRLNDKLSKINYMYDDPDSTAVASSVSAGGGSSSVEIGDTPLTMRNGSVSGSAEGRRAASPVPPKPKVPVKPDKSGSVKRAERNDADITKRDAYFKHEAMPTKYDAPSTKFDPSLRERDGKAEKVDRNGDVSGPAAPKTNGGASRSAPGRGEGSKECEGYVGFANLPNQVFRKSVKRGFEFTFMVVGESGLGKSTLTNSLFLTDLYSEDYPGPSRRVKKTVEVETTQVLLKEGGVQLKLTVVDTPGFGDAVDNSNCWQPVITYIENKYEEFLNSESQVNRKTMPDNRVHCCLYFIAPSGHGLKPLDIEFMKRLHDKVNIIPLIAKADTLTPDECRDFKKTILNEIAQHKIRIYEFPDVDDDEENKTLKKLRDRVPFAVIGSNRILEVNGKRIRGRQYPWGVVEVENLEHNDFLALRDMIVRTHMQDLKDVTNNVHYENFRYNKLAAVGSGDKQAKAGRDPLSQMEEEKRDHELKMKKMEQDMEQVFAQKVNEKMSKLKDSESELHARELQMKANLEKQSKELDERREGFKREKKVWEEQHSQILDQMASSKGNKKKLF